MEKEILDTLIPNDLKEQMIYEDRLPSDPNKDPEFGIPEQKKFPLFDAKHVRSAIRFFNYAEPDYRKSLATKIKAKMKEYGISSSTIGKDNLLRDYFPKKEALVAESTWPASVESKYSQTLSDMLRANQTVIDDINVKLGLDDDDTWNAYMDDGATYLSVKSKNLPSQDLIKELGIYQDQITGPDQKGRYCYSMDLTDKPGFVKNDKAESGLWWQGTHDDYLYEMRAADRLYMNRHAGTASGDPEKLSTRSPSVVVGMESKLMGDSIGKHVYNVKNALRSSKPNVRMGQEQIELQQSYATGHKLGELHKDITNLEQIPQSQRGPLPSESDVNSRISSETRDVQPTHYIQSSSSTEYDPKENKK